MNTNSNNKTAIASKASYLKDCRIPIGVIKTTKSITSEK